MNRPPRETEPFGSQGVKRASVHDLSWTNMDLGLT
jgi:hypothetical protein